MVKNARICKKPQLIFLDSSLMNTKCIWTVLSSTLNLLRFPQFIHQQSVLQTPQLWVLLPYILLGLGLVNFPSFIVVWCGGLDLFVTGSVLTVVPVLMQRPLGLLPDLW